MPGHDQAWREVLLELLGAWPGRLDEMTATAYVASLRGRGVTDSQAVLRELRGYVGEHPPSASVLASLVLRDGQPDPPAFEAIVTFVAQTIATKTKYGDDALSAYVAFVADELHEAAARWVADIGIAALREVPDPRHALEQGQRIRLRDHAQGYAEHVAAWQAQPRRGEALERARRLDHLAGYEVPRLHAVPEIGPGA